MPSHSGSASSAKILLVDDNRHGLTARKTVLEELGHRITTSSSGAEAIEELAAGRFDLVVTDYRMPRMDGLELIRRLRKQTPETPIILISGFVDSLGLNESNTGADAVIQKSANEVTHLVRSVNRLLGKLPKKSVATDRPAKPKRKMQ